MNSRILFIVLFTIFTSCSTTKGIEENNTSNIKLNGITKEFYENGDLKFEWNYENNQLNGITKEYHEDGTYSEWYFKTGKKAIMWEYENDIIISGTGYYPTGEKSVDIGYKNGIQEGITTEYYKTGEKIFEWRFKNGQLKGETIEYDKNGNVKNVLNY